MKGTIIVIIFTLNQIQSLKKEDLCMDMYQFSQTSNFANFKKIRNSDPIGSGAFGTVKKVIYNEIPSVVKIQKFDNFETRKFQNALLEISNLKMFNQDIAMIKRVKDKEFEMRQNNQLEGYDKEKILEKFIIEDAFAFLDSVNYLYFDYYHLNRNDFDFKYQDYFGNLSYRFNNFFEFENLFIEINLINYLKKNGKNNFDSFSFRYYDTLKEMMVLKYYGCVYDPESFELLIFLEELADTFENQISYFKNYYTESERIGHYIYLLTDIRKFHKQYKMVHLDIKPDNIMLSKNFNNKNNSRLKLIDYGLMKKIGEESTDYFKLFSHPILFKKISSKTKTKKKLLVSEFMDIYSFILTIVFVEYGKETITLNAKCYQNFNFECFENLKKKIIKAFCEKIKNDNNDQRNCTNEEDMLENYRPSPYTDCKHLLCYILSNLHFDEEIMVKRIEYDDEWEGMQSVDDINAFELVFLLMKVRNFSQDGNLYYNYLNLIDREVCELERELRFRII